MTPDDVGLRAEPDAGAACGQGRGRMTTTRAGMAVEPADCPAAAIGAVGTSGSVSTALRPNQGLNPTTSLSMIYLREFERVHSTMRGKVRIARRAGHMLRMHWAHVQRRGLAEWSGT